MSRPILLSILIPAYNESKRLPVTLKKIQEYARDVLQESFEILVIDDGSTDNTIGMLEQIGFDDPFVKVHGYEKNRGKGYALRTGMRHAKGRFILFTDADLSTPIEEVQKFLPLLERGAPVVIATRKNPAATIAVHQPFWRETLGKMFTWLTNMMLGLHFSDITCGFKAFSSEAGKDLFGRQRIERWAYDSEVLFLAKHAGYEVQEVPVTWANSSDTRVRLIRDAFTSFTALIAIRWNWMTGKYKRAQANSAKITAPV